MTILRTANKTSTQTEGQYVTLEGSSWYKISNSHRMKPFFLTLVSSSDHWMFVSSNGALSAGRKDRDSALFPYYSADKILDMVHCTGPKTFIKAADARGGLSNGTSIWQPFSAEPILDESRSQNLYKNSLGNRVMFEEVHHVLRMAFRYTWAFGQRYGFIRQCELVNLDETEVEVHITDGLENLMPSGLGHDFQLRYSNLSDAYKKSELLSDASLGLYYLSSIPTDLAEPSEGLRTTVVWQQGLQDATIALSSEQLREVQKGQSLQQESQVRGRRGAFFASKSLDLSPLNPIRWRVVADVNYDHADVVRLRHELTGNIDLGNAFNTDMQSSDEQLLKIISANDGLQVGRDCLRTQRHRSNVLFNVMRGGYPANGYEIDIDDFRNQVKTTNTWAHKRHQNMLAKIPDRVSISELKNQIAETKDADLIRIGSEYLPLCFSRRHGDPTRPWNKFSIDLGKDSTKPTLNYEGNWRDIFQNWEALAVSYPDYAPNMVFRFVNASTADGYNPYRITKNGVEWEEPDPSDPWANIGYWGDHQIIYLLRLLEWSQAFHPSSLDQNLAEPHCTYTDIPYRIRGFEDILRDPQETIDYDSAAAEQIACRVNLMGSDGKLVFGKDQAPHRVTLVEKLLVPMLAKLTNLVPGGGVWLNTQRPEWNDANNALVGRGLSMVTTCYLRRYLTFLIDWFGSERESVPAFAEISCEVWELTRSIWQALIDIDDKADASQCRRTRRQILNQFSLAGQKYRDTIYTEGFSGETTAVALNDLVGFMREARDLIDETIRCNRRADGMYHSYNLVSFTDNAADIEGLYEMLEGQVAVISSGLLSASESLDVLDALRSSDCYREDQSSYMLYPDRKLPSFLEKNLIPNHVAFGSELVLRMVADECTEIVKQDLKGDIRFNGDFRNAKDMNLALDRLQQQPDYRELVSRDRSLIDEMYEETFKHRLFTGRSGTFFGYEGLGSIYWHMVSKLSLSVIEQCVSSQHADASKSCDLGSETSLQTKLHAHYQAIRDGLGLTKKPGHYGAFPFDPYSHTPENAGAQQPGMTGQVKEDILSRWYELGVRINDGRLRFNPALFEKEELLDQESTLEFFDVVGTRRSQSLPPNSFAFTLCQVPVIYHASETERLVIHQSDQNPVTHPESQLTLIETQQLFARTGQISLIEVFFVPGQAFASSAEVQGSGPELSF